MLLAARTSANYQSCNLFWLSVLRVLGRLAYLNNAMDSSRTFSKHMEASVLRPTRLRVQCRLQGLSLVG